MTIAASPPAYAWDWFARQHLLWAEVRRRLAEPDHPASTRYRVTETRDDVLGLLRADYGRDDHVREAVVAVVGERAFLGRTGGRFADLGVRAAPRGLRWWWSAITGERIESALPTSAPVAMQLTLDEVHEGYGG